MDAPDMGDVMAPKGDFEDSLCLSKLHLGPFADDAPVLHRLHH